MNQELLLLQKTFYLNMPIIHELSMSPGSVALIRRVIRSLSLHEAEQTARAAMECRNAAESMELVQQLLARRVPEIAAL